MQYNSTPIRPKLGTLNTRCGDILIVLEFTLYYYILRFIDFSCMSIAVLLQKKLASYVPWFNFDGIFLDKKSGFQIANFLFFSNFAKNGGFSKSSQGYIF